MKNKFNHKLLLFLSTFIAFSSCITLGTVEIEVIKPAKIALAPDVNSLLVLNNSILFHTDSFKHEVQRGLFKLDTTATQYIVQYVNGILNESPRFDTSILLPDIYYRKQTNLLQPIDFTAVKKLCEQNNADALLSLDAFGIIDTIIRISYFDGYGYTTYKNLALIANTMWRVYLPDKELVFEKKIHRDTIFIDEIGSKKEYQNALTQSKNIEYLAGKLAQNIGTQVADRIAPYWEPVIRDFFIYGNTEMQQAAHFAYSDKWREAAIIWKEFTDDENKRIAAAACHNMALVCEVEGKLDIALEWLEESLGKYTYYTTKDYMKQINNRIKEAEKLDKQFGIKTE